MWQEFLRKFLEAPEHYLNEYSINYIVRCEITHWFISAYAGYVAVYLLMQTTYFREVLECQDLSTYRFLFWFGVSVSVLAHICIDAFTQLA